jgi:hypothetical protein
MGSSGIGPRVRKRKAILKSPEEAAAGTGIVAVVLVLVLVLVLVVTTVLDGAISWPLTRPTTNVVAATSREASAAV